MLSGLFWLLVVCDIIIMFKETQSNLAAIHPWILNRLKSRSQAACKIGQMRLGLNTEVHLMFTAQKLEGAVGV